ncbi:MAG TPA: T9SS type A sorting domain-containing protein, partial [Saprospiraceae bacterium]|nr:T9SS type A sorting domain-containing protein [Saprospiraceae bacterium]
FGEADRYDLEIFHMNGQKVYTNSLIMDKGKYTIDLSSANLGKGMYLVRIIHGQEIFNQKLSLN